MKLNCLLFFFFFDLSVSRIISVIISLAVPVCMVVSGGFWFSDCPQEKNIPIYLLVGGIAYLLLRLLNFANKYYGKSNNEDNKLVTKSCFISLIHIFLFVWFILGNHICLMLFLILKSHRNL